MAQDLTKDDLLKMLINGEPAVRARFVKEFDGDVETFANSMAHIIQQLRKFEREVPPERRSAWVLEYLFTAMNSLFISFHLRISGYTIPAGNVIRQWGECVAMALLLSHPKINTFGRFDENPECFPVHNALDILNESQNRKWLGIDKQRWKEFMGLIKFYNKFSHPSVLATAMTRKFDTPKTSIFGAEYDTKMKRSYEIEIKRSLSACRSLSHLIDYTMYILNSTS